MTSKVWCEHLFLNVLSSSDEELTTKQITNVVGCSVQHGINMLKQLKEEGKIEGRQLATKAFLWRGKRLYAGEKMKLLVKKKVRGNRELPLRGKIENDLNNR